MDEEKDQKEERIDWEWEYLKLQARITDVFDEVQLLKTAIKSNSMRIARLKQEVFKRPEEGEEELEEEREERARPGDTLTLEERALVLSKMMDRD